MWRWLNEAEEISRKARLDPSHYSLPSDPSSKTKSVSFRPIRSKVHVKGEVDLRALLRDKPKLAGLAAREWLEVLACRSPRP